MFKVLYYDIEWNVHAADVEAGTPAEAMEKLIVARVCVRSEVITWYDERRVA